MERLVVALFEPDQVERVVGVVLFDEAQACPRVVGLDGVAGQRLQIGQGAAEQRLQVAVGHAMAPARAAVRAASVALDPSSSRSHRASLIGRPVASSTHRYWPLGLISRKT